MKPTEGFYKSLKTKHITYGLLLAAAFSWPWIWMAVTGQTGEGDIVDLISLGLGPALIISAIIVFREGVSRPASYKWAFAIALSAAFLLVWIIPAVGLYGRSGDPADLPFYGVPAVGIIGGLLSRFRPRGMSFTMIAMAAAQMLVSLSGMMAGLGSMFFLNGFFAALWLGSAYMFRRASQANSEMNTHI